MAKAAHYKDPRDWANPEPAGTVGIRLMRLDGGGEHIRITRTGAKRLHGCRVILAGERTYVYERESPDGAIYRETKSVDLADLGD